MSTKNINNPSTTNICWTSIHDMNESTSDDGPVDPDIKTVCQLLSCTSGIPESSILIGFSIINHPFWGTTIFGNTHIGSYRFRILFIPFYFWCFHSSSFVSLLIHWSEPAPKIVRWERSSTKHKIKICGSYWVRYKQTNKTKQNKTKKSFLASWVNTTPQPVSQLSWICSRVVGDNLTNKLLSK